VAVLPRSLVTAFAQLRRDASAVAGRIAGRRSPPLTRRPTAERPAHRGDDVGVATRTAALLSPRTVRVARVVRETPDAVTLVLEDPSASAGRDPSHPPFAFVPGQFFTLLVPIGDEILRRAYSASSDARDGERVAVTVKRLAGGVVSNHLNDHVREGDLLQILGPSGSFTALPDAAVAPRHLVLLAGGSGITPMMAIARTVLAVEPAARVTLVYGNRGEADIIFRAALDELAHAHAPRFVVRHVLSHPPAEWTGGVGMLEEDVVRAELDAMGDLGERLRFYLCGPEPMMRASHASLRARGVPEAQIVEERFNMPHLRPRVAAPLSAEAGPQVLTIHANGAGTRDVYASAGQTMLEAGLSAGIAMDYSCAMGGCGACKVRLCEGEVEMEEPNCLTVQERADGFVLACISRLRKPARIALARDPAYAATAGASATSEAAE
jgi:ring-1,2-phenylacetyl-CoA epoxidase subunit PaaE